MEPIIRMLFPLRFALGQGVKKWMLVLGGILFLLSSCASEDSADCLVRLDNSEFKSVAEDTSCSNYQRASGYLGLAGFLASNFLKEDISSNFRAAVGIPDSVTSYSSWDGSGYYTKALQLTGTSSGDAYEGQTRPNEVIEIHLFATLGSIISETAINLDSNADGTFSQSEIQSFAKIRSSSDASYGKNDISLASWIQFVYDGSVYLIDSSSSSAPCLKDSTADYSGLWNGTGTDFVSCGLISSTAIATAAASGSSITISGTCAAIAKVDEIQNLFSSTVSSNNELVTFAESILTALSRIDTDFSDLGAPSDSDLRSQSSDFSDKFDNGGSCSANSTKTEAEQLLNLISVSTESARTTSTYYKNYNVVALSTLKSSSDNSSITFPTISTTQSGVTISVSCSNSSDPDARLIFKTDAGGYVANYSSAKAATYSVFTSLDNMRKDSSGNVKPDTKGDNKISFSELLCATE